jgi:hypothetical protein
MKDKSGAPLCMPRTLIFQFDNASDQKNKELFAFCSLLCTNSVQADGSIVPAPFDIIYVNFLIPGHTHCSVDQKFSVIARKIISCDGIMTPVSLLNVIKEAFNGSTERVGEIAFLHVVLDWESYLTPFRSNDIHFYGVSGDIIIKFIASTRINFCFHISASFYRLLSTSYLEDYWE